VTDDIVHEWAAIYPPLLHYHDPREAIDWLTRVFGFSERVRMTDPDGTITTSKLESPGGGLVMVARSATEWIRERVPGFREQKGEPWPNLSHTTTVMVDDVDAHYERAQAAGATIVMKPTDHPWGLRSYLAIDLQGHQWEFSQTLRIMEREEWGATRIG
jgi:PhnB protein